MRLFRIVKSVILWSYERGTWQYDMLCILILVFIFLTPGSLFSHRDSAAHNHGQEQAYPPSQPVSPTRTGSDREWGPSESPVPGRSESKLPAKQVKP